MNKSSSPRLFRNLFINPSFQFRFMGYFILIFSLTTVSLYSTTFIFFWKMKQKALDVGIPDGHIYFQFLARQKEQLDWLFFGLAIINFFILIGVGIVISHRIAGPLFKIRQQLEKPDEEREELKFRKNDYFQEFAPVIKKIKDRLNS